MDKKKILITGKNSYIGQSFEAYAGKHYADSFQIDTIDMKNPLWMEKSFASYDAVFHVAGIAHADVEHVSEEVKKEYYEVNTDLAVAAANKAKKDGVKQFVFMSSMIIYGDSAPYGKRKMISAATKPQPANFYGDSKWRADQGVRDLADEMFHVAVLRPPMIYGKGSKGNYPVLAKLAKKLPVFPDVQNERSMLHIDNLCEFLCRLMLTGQGGIFFPQNAEYTKTSDMVKEISMVCGRKILVTKLLNPMVWFASKMPGKISRLVNKAFGNSCYEQSMSEYEDLPYQVVDLKESIRRTEGEKSKGKKVLFLVNHDVVIYNFRLELVERLLSEKYEVYVSSPYGERIDDLVALGCHYYEINMNRHGMNPLEEVKLFHTYKKQIKEINPDVILGYTIKPNMYGSIVARSKHIPFVANITGLGSAVENPGIRQNLLVAMYRYAFRNIQRVFFQNEENQQFFLTYKIAQGKNKLLPGSGVNLKRFPLQEYPGGDVIRFAFISRIMKEKGIDQYLDMATYIKKKYPNTEFHVCGFCEENYEAKLKEMESQGIIIYHGMIRDVASFLTEIHCVVHPTYYPEGISNVLLEACASGRPVITTDRSGCREVVDDGVNGYLVLQKDEKSLKDAIEKFLQLGQEERRKMGLAARKKVEERFDRQIVVEAYMREIVNAVK